MNKLKLRKKLLVAFSLIAIISIILTAVFSTAAFWFVFADQEENDIRNYAITVARNYDADGEISELESYSSSSTRVTLISQDGTVLYDSTENSENMSNHLNRPEVQEALKDGYGSSNRMSSTLNSTTYYYAVRTNDGNVIRVSNTISSIFSVFVKVLPAIIVIVAGVFIICVVLSRCTTKKIINPIERMTQDLDDTTYEELVPLAEKISSQNESIRESLEKESLKMESEDAAAQTETEQTETGDYILPQSSTEVLTEEDIEGLSAEELLLARNEIYARHGRKFSTPEIQAYFDSKSWYNGTISPEDFDTSVLNSTERANVSFIKSHE